MRRVNVRLVVILAIIAFVGGAGVFGLYTFQHRRHATFFRDRAKESAETLKDTEEPDPELISQAIDFYRRYLGLYPDDTEALAELGMLYYEHGGYEPAFFTFEKVLRLDPNRTDIRRKVVPAAMMLRPARISDARAHLEDYLLQEYPNDPELLDLLGQCQLQDGENEAAVDSFEKAVENGSKQYQTYHRLARLCVEKLKKPEQGDKYMDKLIADNPDDATALTVCGQYQLFCADEKTTKEEDREERVKKALENAQKALKIAPEDREALTLAAEVASRLEDDELATEYGNRLVELYPGFSRGYITLAEMHERQGDQKKAVEQIREGLVETEESPSLLWALAQYLIEDKQFEEAEETLNRIRVRNFDERNPGKRAFTDSRLKHAAAYMEAKKGHWKAALQMFQANRADVTDNPTLLRQADYWISKCYGELGNVDQQLSVIGNSVRNKDGNRARYAQALARAGKIDEAIKEWQTLLALGKAPDGAILEVARLLVLRNKTLPKSKQNWDQVFDLIDQAEESDPDRYQIATLRSEAYREKGELDQARTILKEAIAESPDQFALRNRQISLEIAEKNWAEVDKLFAALKTDLEDSPSARLLQARYLLARYGKDAAAKLHDLEKGIDSFSSDEKKRLMEGLASSARQAGDLEYSKSLTERLVQDNPQDLSSQLALFELASRNRDNEEMKKQLQKLREIEGEGPYWHYGTALRLISQYHQAEQAKKKPEKQLLEEALKHLAEARVQRPGWGQVMVLTATVYDQLDNRERAIEYFDRALELGDRNPTVIRRQVVLLFQDQRFDEADRVISLLDEEVIKSSEELSRIWAEIKLLRGDYEKALELAEVSAKKSENYRDHVWLGRVYAAMAQRAEKQGDNVKKEKLAAEAEKSLMKALQMNQTDPQTWVALVQMLSATGNRQKALGLIEEAKTKIEPSELSTALAKMYEMAGNSSAARGQLLEELKANPNDPIVLKRAADFFIRKNQPAEAREILNRMIAGKETPQRDVVWARRRLALTLFELGGYQNYLKSIKLMDENLKLDPNSLFDKRIKARVLATRATKKQRKEAISMIENLLTGDQTGTAEDRFVLARLYLAEGNWSKASEQMRQLLSVSGDNPKYLDAFIRDLIKRGEGREADIWVDQLEKLAPKAFATADLKAQVLAEQGKTEEAIEVLKNFLSAPDTLPLDKTQRLLPVARTLETIGRRLKLGDDESAAASFNRAAEGVYRRYVEKRPKEELLLGTFLAQQGRLDNAIEVLENSWREADSRPLGAAAVSMIVGTDASDSQLKRIEKVLDDALGEKKDSVPLLLAKAELCIFQDRDNDAEKIYRDVIKRNPRNVVALNNLAVFLANRRTDVDNALKLINQCIELAGPVSPLLDSRASVYLAQKNWEAAIEDLEEAIADTPTPARYFHLAEAHHGFQDTNDAISALREAHRLGLSRRDLRKAEISRYEALLKDLKMKPHSR